MYAAMGMAGFDYNSIKDSIKDFGLKVRDYRKQVATIGRYFAMSDENFDEMDSITKLDDITAEDIREAVERGKNG